MRGERRGGRGEESNNEREFGNTIYHLRIDLLETPVLRVFQYSTVSQRVVTSIGHIIIEVGPRIDFNFNTVVTLFHKRLYAQIIPELPLTPP